MTTATRQFKPLVDSERLEAQARADRARLDAVLAESERVIERRREYDARQKASNDVGRRERPPITPQEWRLSVEDALSVIEERGGDIDDDEDE